MESGTATAPRQGLPADDERPTTATATRRAVQRSGGWTAITIASAPTAAFVVTNALGGLTWALTALAGTATATFAVRLVRRESLRSALIGLVIAAGCTVVAALTGEAQGFFLVPTLLPASWTLLFLGSVLIGRPLTGIALNGLAGGPRNWRHHPPLRRVYNRTSLIASGICFLNFVLGGLLYLSDQLVAMAAMDIAVLPVPFVLAAFTVAAARRAIRRTSSRHLGPPGLSGDPIASTAQRRTGRTTHPTTTTTTTGAPPCPDPTSPSPTCPASAPS